MDFSLRQLEYLVAAVDYGSITAAAESCHVSPGAVSLALQELEKQLGHILLIRKRAQGITPTSDGLSLLPYARRIVAQSEELHSYSRDLTQELVGRVTIGCYTTLSPFVIPFLAAQFAEPFPQMTVDFVEGSSDNLQQRMLAGEIDCVIMQERQREEGVRLERIRARTPHILLPTSHPRAQQPIVSLHDLVNEPMVLLDVEAVRRTLLPLLHGLGIFPTIRWRSTQIETVRAMVARGLGWSIMIQRPPTNLSYEAIPLITREIAEPIGRNDICVAFPEGIEPSYRLSVLTKLLREHASVT